MKTEFMYEPFDKLVYRVPAYPFSHLNSILKHDTFRILSDVHTMESIYLASPILYEELRKIGTKSKVEPQKKQRIINSYVKYICRMSTRCTPFGLFASCSVGEINKETSLFLSETNARSTRLDMFYLCELSQFISKLADVKKQMQYYPNNTIYKIGKNLRYIEYKYVSDRRIHSVVSIKSTPILEQMIKIARSGTSIEHLLQYLTEHSFEKNSAEIFINDLIESQILIGELEVTISGESYLDKLIDRLSKMNLSIETSCYFNALREISSKLHEADSNKNNDIEFYKKVINKINLFPISYKENCLFQVDITNEKSTIKIGDQIIEEIQSVLSYLLKLSSPYENQLLNEFQQEFYKRYEEQTIPLSIALDPELGIGYPISHGIADISPIIDEIILPYSARMITSKNNIQSILVNSLMKGLNQKEILLSANEEEIYPHPSNLPPTLYVIFQIIRDEKNDLLLYIKGVGGGSAANLLSRFASLNKNINGLINEITNKEKESYIDGILAEIVHLPGSRVGNILARPHLRDYEITYISESNYPESKKIPISDLLLSCRDSKLVLQSKKLKKRIYPKSTNAHNYYNDTLPVYRFLCDMQHQNLLAGIEVNWGELGKSLDYKPRIKYKNSILSLAAWTIHHEEIQIFEKLEDSELVSAISNWRNSRNIPQHVQLSDSDNELFVDFSSQISIQALFSLVKNRATFIISEFPFDIDNLAVKGEKGDYLNEFIVAFHKK